MWETILVQFKDTWIPKEWLSPVIYIREIDWDLVIDWEDMTEIDNGRYSYIYEDYITTRTYLIDADWGSALSDLDRYFSNINELDSYQNKWAWTWPAVFIDYDKIAELSAKKVRDEKTKEHTKEWTYWVAVLCNDIDFSEILIKLKEHKKLIESIEFPEIKIPKQKEFDYTIILKAIENNKPEEINLSDFVEPILQKLENIENKDIDFSQIRDDIKSFDNNIVNRLNKLLFWIETSIKEGKIWNISLAKKIDDKKAIEDLADEIKIVQKRIKGLFNSINNN